MKIRFKTIKLNYKFLLSFFTILVLSISMCLYSFVNASGQTEKDGIRVPIIMYHSILKSKSNKYIVSPEQLENDFKYIKEKGYTTITMTDLIEYVYNDVSLPEKPIIITFDDAYYNNYTYLVPLLREYNMKAVISVVGEFTNSFTTLNQVNSNYGYLRWIDIQILMSEGLVEFQNHTYDLHSNTNGRRRFGKKIWRISREL